MSLCQRDGQSQDFFIISALLNSINPEPPRGRRGEYIRPADQALPPLRVFMRAMGEESEAVASEAEVPSQPPPLATSAGTHSGRGALRGIRSGAHTANLTGFGLPGLPAQAATRITSLYAEEGDEDDDELDAEESQMFCSTAHPPNAMSTGGHFNPLAHHTNSAGPWLQLSVWSDLIQNASVQVHLCVRAECLAVFERR